MTKVQSPIDALFAKIERRNGASEAASAATSTASDAEHLGARTAQRQLTPSEWARIMREWIDNFEQAMNVNGNADLTGTFEEMHDAFYVYVETLREVAAKNKEDEI